VDIANLAVLHGLAQAVEGGVEPSLEGHHAQGVGLLNHGAHLVDDLQVEGDGLLAEDELAGPGASHDLVRVLVSGGADEHGIHLRVLDQVIGVLNVLRDAIGLAHLLSALLPDISHHDDSGALDSGNGLDVDLADTANTDHTNAKDRGHG